MNSEAFASSLPSFFPVDWWEDEINTKCQSPVEKQFAWAWLTRNGGRVDLSDRHWNDFRLEVPNGWHWDDSFNWMLLQQPVGKYRADFLLRRATLVYGIKNTFQKLPPIIVEIDGHDFHERTKEQAAHDKSRDRYMTIEGYTVMRFTGSEIYRNASACAQQVDSMFWKFWEPIQDRMKLEWEQHQRTHNTF